MFKMNYLSSFRKECFLAANSYFCGYGGNHLTLSGGETSSANHGTPSFHLEDGEMKGTGKARLQPGSLAVILENWRTCIQAPPKPCPSSSVVKLSLAVIC